jgi:hypothetical protein
MTATDELRGYALSVRNIALRTTSLCHEARRDLLDSAVRMEQAADTIERHYDDGFDNGVKAVLQQLDGLIHEGADVDDIQGWIDRQWEEEV